MAFTQSTFGPISSHGNSDMPNIWTYRTGDSKVQVSAADYFIKKYPLINDGDFINVQASNGVFSGNFVESGGQFTIVDLNTGGGGGSSLDQDQMIYVTKAGNDASTGLNINEPKLTIPEAILDAILLTPSESNQIVITGPDAGNYTGAINLPEWVHLSFPNASYDGICDVADNCIVQFRRMMRTTAGGSCIKKTTGAGFAKVSVELLIVTAGQNGFLLNSGVGHLDVGVITIDGGIGIKAKNGSRVSAQVSEVQLSNGGVGLGTQTAGGGANAFNIDILNARDDGTGVLIETKVSGDIVNIKGGSFIVDTLYDMGANSTLNSFATESSGARVADPTATVSGTLAGVSSFNPTTGIVIERVLEAVSLAASQEPAGLGIANAIQIEFGAAQFTVSDPVMIDVNGSVTFNEAGMYRVKSVFQFGRTGASGTSELLFRLLVDGVQLGRSVGVKLGNSDDLSYIDIDNWFNVPAGTVLDTEVMRDDVGSNSGGIFQTLPTDEGAGTWEPVPCTVLRIERWASP